MKLSTILAAVAGLSTVAAPVGAAQMMAAAGAVLPLAEQAHTQSRHSQSPEMLQVRVNEEVRTGADGDGDGDTTLWQVRWLDVMHMAGEPTGWLSAGLTDYTCPAGLTPSTPREDDGGPYCEATPIEYLSGEVVVDADQKLGSVTVTGTAEESDPVTWETVAQHPVDLTFSASGERTRFTEDSWGGTTKGWKRAMTTDGDLGPVALDGLSAEASRQTTTYHLQETTLTWVEGYYSSLTSEPAADGVNLLWEQVALSASDSRNDVGWASDSFSGVHNTWVCAPGVHPIEDEPTEDDSPVCLESSWTDFYGESVEVTGDAKLGGLTVTGTAYVGEELVDVDLTFTGEGKAVKEKVSSDFEKGHVTTRSATVTGSVGSLRLDAEPAKLTHSVVKTVLGG